MELDKETIRKYIGDPAVVVKRMMAYTEAVKLISSQHSKLVAEYPDQWIAATFDGKVEAHADTQEALLAEVDARELPRRSLIIRFMETRKRKLIV